MCDTNPDFKNSLEVLGELVVIGLCSVLIRVFGLEDYEEEADSDA